MASVQYYLPCSAATTTTTITTSTTITSLRKPSHFMTHAKRGHRLNVSCQNQTDNKGKLIDRRNMLLGLGGLYGAANLVSTPGQASANPIDAPELDKGHLGRNWNKMGQPLDEHCCLINDPSKVPVDNYEPSNSPMRKRKPAHSLKLEEIQDFKNAIGEMKKLSHTDPHSFHQQSLIHCAYCNASYFQPDTNSIDLQVHHNWLFFPFHRWYIYFFEKICGKLIGNPNFALPYWNWDNSKGGMTVPSIFMETGSPLYDNIRDWDNTVKNPSKPVWLGGDPNATPKDMIENNTAQMYKEMMTDYSSPYEFMGFPYHRGMPWRYDGEGKSEGGAHNSIHYWIGTKAAKDPQNMPNSTGEDLGNFYSAGKDPLFYCHHSNVDRMWDIWQKLDTRTNKFIKDNDFLETKFIFYDEDQRLVRVKVKDCVHAELMGYAYEDQETPWKEHKPPPPTGETKPKIDTNNARPANDVFPKPLDETVSVVVSKSQKGKADEYLEIENISYDTSEFVKFDVFVNDKDKEGSSIQKASYAGTFSHVPTKSSNGIVNKATSKSNKFRLTDLYEYMDVADDDAVLVTLVPRQGPGISIGGIKIIENPYKSEAASS